MQLLWSRVAWTVVLVAFCDITVMSMISATTTSAAAATTATKASAAAAASRFDDIPSLALLEIAHRLDRAGVAQLSAVDRSLHQITRDRRTQLRVELWDFSGSVWPTLAQVQTAVRETQRLQQEGVDLDRYADLVPQLSEEHWRLCERALFGQSRPGPERRGGGYGRPRLRCLNPEEFRIFVARDRTPDELLWTLAGLRDAMEWLPRERDLNRMQWSQLRSLGPGVELFVSAHGVVSPFAFLLPLYEIRIARRTIECLRTGKRWPLEHPPLDGVGVDPELLLDVVMIVGDEEHPSIHQTAPVVIIVHMVIERNPRRDAETVRWISGQVIRIDRSKSGSTE